MSSYTKIIKTRNIIVLLSGTRHDTLYGHMKNMYIMLGVTKSVRSRKFYKYKHNLISSIFKLYVNAIVVKSNV